MDGTGKQAYEHISPLGVDDGAAAQAVDRPPIEFPEAAFDVVAMAASAGGLTAEEAIGHLFLDLDIGLPVDEIPVAAILAGKAESEVVEIQAVNRRGKTVTCGVFCHLFAGDEEEFRGVLIIIEEVD